MKSNFILVCGVLFCGEFVSLSNSNERARIRISRSIDQQDQTRREDQLQDIGKQINDINSNIDSLFETLVAVNAKLAELETKVSITLDKKLVDLGTNLMNRIEEKLLEKETCASFEFKKLSARMDIFQSEIDKSSEKAESSNQIHLKATEIIKVEIKELLHKMNELSNTSSEAHLTIPVDVIKSTNETLNASLYEMKDELESQWNVSFNQFKTSIDVELNTSKATLLRTITQRLQHLQKGISCKDIKTKEYLLKTGEYFIQPDITNNSVRKVKIYCDMENDGGGWSVIQRRGVRDIPKAQRESFNRSWVEYENGFGLTDDDHWIGLRNIYFLTHQNDCGCELMIKLTNWEGVEKYAKFSEFSISGSEDFYRLNISGYTGNVTDNSQYYTMLYNKNMRFSTIDEDNDKWIGNCAATEGGAWWHHACTYVYLNGEYSEDGQMGKREDNKGINWWSRDRDAPSSYSYMKTEMKIKSKC